MQILKIIDKHINIFVSVITKIVNMPLEYATFPSHFKNALVSPLIKKPSLDADNLKNFRPLSNLCFISKIVEKVVAHRLVDHLSTTYMNSINQPTGSITAQKQHSLKFKTTSYANWMVNVVCS